ncbi:MAG: hypothetical protein QOE28_1749, partial [Solirubrobacteraceae bacterium]|nr:hypothetical protein [Solirubrobacteraceae bacterium]
LFLRFYDLGARPFHHDESQDAYFSYVLRTGGGYHYDPLLHGPVRFYLTALAYLLFGDSDFTARLAPALMGTALVAMPYLLRRQLGRVAAFAAGVLLAAGPTYLYFSRFAREDIYVAAITMAMIAVAFRFVTAPRRHHPALLLGLLSLSFATKESTFITVFVGGSFFIVALIWQARHSPGGLRTAPLWRSLTSVGRDAWLWGIVAFLAVYTVMFTTFFTHPSGVYGLYTGLKYWIGQHSVHRGGEPLYFYVVVLFAEEWPMLLLGGIGAVLAFRRPTLLRLFLVWAFVVSLAVYSWAGEKFSWLVLHPLLPLILLAGIGIQAIWEARRRWFGAAGLAVTVLALAYSGYASFLVNAEHGADPREFLVSTQSSTEVKQTALDVLALAKRRPDLRVTIDGDQGATFPWAWYFRHLNVGYIDLSQGVTELPQTDVLVMTEQSRLKLLPQLIGFDGHRFRFRVWWVRDYGAQSPGNWIRWLAERKPWNPTGGLPEWIYTRRVVEASGG